MKVLRVGPPSARSGHQRVVLDGGRVLRVRADDVDRLGVEAGSDLDDTALAWLRTRAEDLLATEIAQRLLAVRLRSRQEIEQRLQRRGVSRATLESVLERLSDAGLIDDIRFARAWVSGRQALRPSGKIRLQRELRQKGVDSETIEQALREAFSESDEYQLALAVARARLRRYRGEAPDVAYRRLAGVLQRRGFSAGAITRTLREVLGHAAAVNE